MRRAALRILTKSRSVRRGAIPRRYLPIVFQSAADRCPSRKPTALRCAVFRRLHTRPPAEKTKDRDGLRPRAKGRSFRVASIGPVLDRVEYGIRFGPVGIDR